MTQWESQQVTLAEDDNLTVVPRENCQIVTETSEQSVTLPYLAYIPESQKLLLLVTCGFPHQVNLMTSDDLGTTWSDPRPILPDDPEKRSWLGLGITWLGAGRLALAASASPSSEHRRFRSYSDDCGQTWSDPVPIQRTSDGIEWHQWDPWLVDSDPETGQASRVAETGYICLPENEPCPRGGYSQAMIRFSEDLGRTWQNEIRPPQWHKSDEVALCRAGNGTIVAACRINPPEPYWHDIDHYEGLGFSLSKDDGLTWSDVQVFYEWGRHHPSMVRMPNDDIAMTYVGRKGYPDSADGYPQFGIEAIVSRDHGETWDMAHRYMLSQWKGNAKGEAPELEADFRAKWPRWFASCQATSTQLLPDGTLLTVFGTGYRSAPTEHGHCSPRDVGLVRWMINE